MKLSKMTLMAALVAGNLVVLGATSRAADTNAAKPPAGGPSAMQQNRRGPGASLDELNLTPEQKTKVEALLKAQQEKMHALRTDSSLSSEDRRAKMQELRKGLNSQMKEILTPEQFAKWEKHAQPRRSGGSGEKPEAGANAPAAPKE
jgi:periplasmic protein CpxP/Spy